MLLAERNYYCFELPRRSNTIDHDGLIVKIIQAISPATDSYQ